jgi:subtilisin family serine protease
MQDPAVKRVRIAHLDTGYPDPTQYASYPMPPNFRADLSADCYELTVHQPPEEGCEIAATSPGAGVDRSLGEHTLINSYLHGAGTLSILAGGFVDDPSQKCAPGDVAHWGANPCAEVLEVRIGPSFLHFDEESMALGIRQAVETQADVISLSHGGFPASILSDAVDDAYKNGVAVFAASGDYFGPFTPKTVVFPARYAQVMDIAAATSDYRSAGVTSCWLCIFKFFSGDGFAHNFEEWLIGTNYGPASIMAGHVVAAYSPNITYYDAHAPAGLSNDENGTSAATPQAAAAASLWLQEQRDKIESDILPNGTSSWQSWQKAEAVYQVMLKSSVMHPLSGYSNDALKEYYRLYFGAGLLNAPDMLTQKYVRPDDCLHRAHSRADLFWITDALGSIGIFEVLPEFNGSRAVRDVSASVR